MASGKLPLWLVCLNICQQKESQCIETPQSQAVTAGGASGSSSAKCKTKGRKMVSTLACGKNLPVGSSWPSSSNLHSSAPPKICFQGSTFQTRVAFSLPHSGSWKRNRAAEFIQRKNRQCQNKGKTQEPGWRMCYITYFLLIEFIYLSSINNLRCDAQWYANEQFKFNEFLMTKQIISRALCGVHVI